jgi:hypothetical protein
LLIAQSTMDVINPALDELINGVNNELHQNPPTITSASNWSATISTAKDTWETPTGDSTTTGDLASPTVTDSSADSSITTTSTSGDLPPTPFLPWTTSTISSFLEETPLAFDHRDQELSGPTLQGNDVPSADATVSSSISVPNVLALVIPLVGMIFILAGILMHRFIRDRRHRYDPECDLAISSGSVGRSYPRPRGRFDADSIISWEGGLPLPPTQFHRHSRSLSILSMGESEKEMLVKNHTPAPDFNKRYSIPLPQLPDQEIFNEYHGFMTLPSPTRSKEIHGALPEGRTKRSSVHINGSVSLPRNSVGSQPKGAQQAQERHSSLFYHPMDFMTSRTYKFCYDNGPLFFI